MRSKKNVLKIFIISITILLLNAGLAFAVKDSLDCRATGSNNMSGAEYILPGGWIVPNKVSVSPGIEAGDDTTAKIKLTSIFLDTVTVSLGTSSHYKYIKQIIISYGSASISKSIGSVTNITSSPIKIPVSLALNISRELYVLVQLHDTVPATTDLVFTIDSLHAWALREDGTYSYNTIDPSCPNSSKVTVKMKLEKLTAIGASEANNMYPSSNFIIPANSKPHAVFKLTLGQSKTIPTDVEEAKISFVKATVIDTEGHGYSLVINPLTGEKWPNPANIDLNDIGLSGTIPPKYMSWAIYKDIGNTTSKWDDADVKITSYKYNALYPDPDTTVPMTLLNPPVEGVPFTFKFAGGDQMIPQKSDSSDSSSEYSYLICITTNQGWGPGKVGYGDEFQLKFESVGFKKKSTSDEEDDDGSSSSTKLNASTIVYADTNIIESIKSDSVTDMIYEVVGPVYGTNLLNDTKPSLLDLFTGIPGEDPQNGKQDLKYLDYWPDGIVILDIAGGPENAMGDVLSNQQLRRIDLEFVGRDFQPSDLRPFTSDKNSGLAIYANGPTSNRQTFDIMDPPSPDPLKPLSVSKTQWYGPYTNLAGDTYYKVSLYLADGVLLPIDNNGDQTHGWDFIVTILTSKSIDYKDSFYIRIPPGGVVFTNGISNSTPKIHTSDNDLLNHPGLSYGVFYQSSVPTVITDFVHNDPYIPQSSKPYPVLGINAKGKNNVGDTAYFNKIGLYFMSSSGVSWTPDDLLPLDINDPLGSGVLIYQDNDDNPENKNGEWDEGDTLLIPTLATWDEYFGDKGHYSDAIAYMEFDTIPIPWNDTKSDSSDGSDFFVCVRTSSVIDNGHNFYVRLTKSAEIEYASTLNPLEPSQFFESKNGLPDDVWLFNSDVMIVKTLSTIDIQPLTITGQQIDAKSDPLPVFGFNVTDGTAGEEKLLSVKLIVEDDMIMGNFNPTSDLMPLSMDATSGVAVYKDNGTIQGVFDTSDEFVSMGLPEWDTSDSSVTLRFIYGQDIPDNDSGDNTGIDYFIVIRTSTNIKYGSDFICRIPPEGIEFTRNTSNENDDWVTDLITATVPNIFDDITSNPYQTIAAISNPIGVVGMKITDGLTDGTDGRSKIAELKVQFSNIGGDNNFTSGDLNNLAKDKNSGVSVWKDMDANGEFNSDYDTIVPLAQTPKWQGAGPGDSFVTILFFDTNSAITTIPDTYTGKTTGHNFFLVIRSSSNISYNDDFNISIPKYGLQFTSGKSGSHIVTRTIKSNSLNVIQVFNEVIAGQYIEPFGDSSVMLSFDVRDADGVKEYIKSIRLVFNNNNGDTKFSPTDLLDWDKGGIQLYRDSNFGINGEYDTTDIFIPFTEGALWNPRSDIASSTYSILLSIADAGDSVSPLPDNLTGDNEGADYFILIATSSTCDFNDKFSLSIPKYGIEYSTGDQNPYADFYSETLSVGVPTTFKDMLAENGSVYLPANSDTKSIIGINVYDNADNGNGGIQINSILVQFYNIDGFKFDDLANPDTGIMSGISLYVDNKGEGTTGVLDDKDTFVELLSISSFPSDYRFSLTPKYSIDIPNQNDGSGKPDVFVAIKTSASSDFWKEGNKFRYGIPAQGITFTNNLKNAYGFQSVNNVIADVSGPGAASSIYPASGVKTYKDGETITISLTYTSSIHDYKELTVWADFSGIDSNPLISASDYIETATTNGQGVYTLEHYIATDNNIADGTNKPIYIYAKDPLDNESTLDPWYAELDNVPPVCYSLYTYDDSQYKNQNVLINGNPVNYPIYKNGSVITLYTTWDNTVTRVIADIGAIDSVFSAKEVSFTKISGTDTWYCSYTVSMDNSTADTSAAYIKISGYDGDAATDTYWSVALDNTLPTVSSCRIDNIAAIDGSEKNPSTSYVKLLDEITVAVDTVDSLDSSYTSISFAQIAGDAAPYGKILGAPSPNGKYIISNFSAIYTLNSTYVPDIENTYLTVKLKDVAGNEKTIDTYIISLDKTKPTGYIKLPANNQVFNSPLINIIGTAYDPDGNSTIPEKQASEIYKVRIKVEADTNLDGDYSDSTWYNGVEAINASDTVHGKMDFEQWQFLLTCAETANLQITINIIDNAGNASSYVDTTILKYRPYYTDVSPAELSYISVMPNPFSPDSDGIKDYTLIEYQLNKNVDTTTLRVYNYNRNLVKTVVMSNQRAGANQIKWDGTNDGLFVVAEGNYILDIEIIDKSENISRDSVTVRVDYTKPVVSNLTVFPNPFSPDKDGIKEYTTIYFTVSGIDASASLGEISLVKQAGTPSLLVQPEFLTGPNMIPVPSEVVLITKNLIKNESRFILRGKDIDGNTAYSEEVLITAGTKAGILINISGIYSEVSNFSYWSVEASDSESFSNLFELRTKAGVAAVKICELNGTEIESLDLQKAFIGNGDYSAIWTGQGQSDANYLYKVIVEDEAGNETIKEGRIRILTTEGTGESKSMFKFIPAANSFYNPTVKGRLASVSAELLKKDLGISMENSSILLKKASTGEIIPGYKTINSTDRIFEYNFVYPLSELAANDGEYQIILETVDDFGNILGSYSSTFIIDSQKPEVLKAYYRNSSGDSLLTHNDYISANIDTFAVTVKDNLSGLLNSATGISIEHFSNARGTTYLSGIVTRDSSAGEYDTLYFTLVNPLKSSDTNIDGNCTMAIVLFDNAGNTIEYKINFIIDYTPPVISVSNPVNFAKLSSGTKNLVSTDLVLILDVSGSMGSGPGSPMEGQIQAAYTMIDNMPAGAQIGIVTFHTTASLLHDLSSDKTSLKNAVSSIVPVGLIYYAPAISIAVSMLDNSKALNKKIVMISDGQPFDPDAGLVMAANAKGKGYTIDSIGFGSVISYFDILKQIASVAGGTFYSAPSNSQLEAITKGIIQSVASSSNFMGTIIDYGVGVAQLFVNNVSIPDSDQNNFATWKYDYTPKVENGYDTIIIRAYDKIGRYDTKVITVIYDSIAPKLNMLFLSDTYTGSKIDVITDSIASVSNIYISKNEVNLIGIINSTSPSDVTDTANRVKIKSVKISFDEGENWSNIMFSGDGFDNNDNWKYGFDNDDIDGNGAASIDYDGALKDGNNDGDYNYDPEHNVDEDQNIQFISLSNPSDPDTEALDYGRTSSDTHYFKYKFDFRIRNTYDFMIKIIDEAGNDTVIGNYYFVHDNNPPIINNMILQSKNLQTGDTIFYKKISELSFEVYDNESQINKESVSCSITNNAMTNIYTGSIFWEEDTKVVWYNSPVIDTINIRVGQTRYIISQHIWNNNKLKLVNSKNEDVTVKFLVRSEVNNNVIDIQKLLVPADEGVYKVIYNPAEISELNDTGLMKAYFYAKDISSNETYKIMNFSFYAGDSIAPEVLSTIPHELQLYSDKMNEIILNVSDNNAGLDLNKSDIQMHYLGGLTITNFDITGSLIAGEKLKNYSQIKLIPNNYNNLSNGIYRIAWILYDIAGNVNSDSIIFYYNKEAPQISLVEDDALGYIKVEGDIIRFRVTGGRGTDTSIIVNSTNLYNVKYSNPPDNTKIYSFEIKMPKNFVDIRRNSSYVKMVDINTNNPEFLYDESEWTVNYSCDSIIFTSSDTAFRYFLANDSLTVNYIEYIPNAVVSLDIGSIIKGIELSDDNNDGLVNSADTDGIYETDFKISQKISIRNSPVIVYMKDQYGNDAPIIQRSNPYPAANSIGINIDGVPPLITNVVAVPSPYSPYIGVCKIFFTSDEKITYNIYIYDSSNKLVRSFVNQSGKSGENLLEWDGRDMNAAPVSNGLYEARITAYDVGNNRSEMILNIRVISMNFSVSNIVLSPNPISPNRDNVNDRVNISFNVTLDAGNNQALRDLGITFTDDKLVNDPNNLSSGQDTDEEPFVVLSFILYNSKGQIVQTIDKDWYEMEDEDWKLCSEVIGDGVSNLTYPYNRSADLIKSNDYSVMLQLFDSGIGDVTDELNNGRFVGKFEVQYLPQSLAEDIYLISFQAELVRKKIIVDHITTVPLTYYYHAEPEYITGLKSPTYEARLIIDYPGVNLPDNMPPYITSIKAVKETGSSESIEQAVTFDKAITRIDIKIQDDEGGSDLDPEKIAVTVKDINGNQIYGQDINYELNERRFVFSEPLKTKGDYSVIIKAYDKAGNNKEYTYTFSIADIKAPNIVSWILLESSTGKLTNVPGNILAHSFDKIKVEVEDEGDGVDFVSSRVVRIDRIKSMTNHEVIETYTGTLSAEQIKPYLVYDLDAPVRLTSTSNLFKVSAFVIDLSPAQNRIDTYTTFTMARSQSIIVDTYTFSPNNPKKIRSSADLSNDTKMVLTINTDTQTVRDLWVRIYNYNDNAGNDNYVYTERLTQTGLGKYEFRWGGMDINKKYPITVNGDPAGVPAERKYYINIFDSAAVIVASDGTVNYGVLDDHINWDITVDNLPPNSPVVNMVVNGVEDTALPFIFDLTTINVSARLKVYSQPEDLCSKVKLYLGSKYLFTADTGVFVDISGYIDTMSMINSNKFDTVINMVLIDDIGNTKEYSGYMLNILYSLPILPPIIEFTDPLGEKMTDTVGMIIRGRAFTGRGGLLDFSKTGVYIKLFVYASTVFDTVSQLYEFSIPQANYNANGEWWYYFYDNQIQVNSKIKRWFVAIASDVDNIGRVYSASTADATIRPIMYYNKSNNTKLQIVVIGDENSEVRNKFVTSSMIIPLIKFEAAAGSSTEDDLIRLFLYESGNPDVAGDTIVIIDLKTTESKIESLPQITNLKIQTPVGKRYLRVMSADKYYNLSVMSDPMEIEILNNDVPIPQIVDSNGNPVLSTEPAFNPDNGEQLIILVPGYRSSSNASPSLAGASGAPTARLEVYSLSGQKIYSKEENVSANGTITWNGFNYKGTKVKNGLYLIKVNKFVYPVAIVK
ncbi:VWA domain-containing protein [Candidatus Dependentiae bacterium]|nr:VWA domain-containing protein [Candidatus Dependentiae bacterium]